MRSVFEWLAAGLLTLAMASPAFALENENLLVNLPAGYKVGHNARNQKQLISEMVPAGETVENWTEMVTVNIYFNQKTRPADYRANMEKLWAGACPGGTSASVSEDKTNGYAAMLWRQSCPLNKQTGKPEMTWFKVVAGNDSFYVVQKAFKFEPAPEKLAEWIAFLNKVSVCDTRLKDRACPAGMK